MSKTPEERKAYQAEWLAKKREKLSTNETVNVDKIDENVDKRVQVNKAVDKVEFIADFDQSIFEGKGNGVPVQANDGNRYVLIAGKVTRSNGSFNVEPSRVVSEQNWLARVNAVC